VGVVGFKHAFFPRGGLIHVSFFPRGHLANFLQHFLAGGSRQIARRGSQGMSITMSIQSLEWLGNPLVSWVYGVSLAPGCYKVKVQAALPPGGYLLLPKTRRATLRLACHQPPRWPPFSAAWQRSARRPDSCSRDPTPSAIRIWQKPMCCRAASTRCHSQLRLAAALLYSG
jgi:hypothetical protein